MVNPYTCHQCDWEYVWTMGDRVKAGKRHQLAHLLEQRGKQATSGDEIPAYRLTDYLDERLRTLELH